MCWWLYYSLYVIPWYCNCWDYLLLHEDWGECSEDWAGAWGGGGWVELKSFFFPTKFFFQKCSWGSETHANKNLFFGGGGGFWGVWGRPTPPPGGRAGSENNTLLPMTMICDRLKFWSGPAWRSKVIIRKPWRRKNKKNKNKKFWQNHKAFPAGSRECLINPTYERVQFTMFPIQSTCMFILFTQPSNSAHHTNQLGFHSQTNRNHSDLLYDMCGGGTYVEAPFFAIGFSSEQFVYIS